MGNTQWLSEITPSSVLRHSPGRLEEPFRMPRNKPESVPGGLVQDKCSTTVVSLQPLSFKFVSSCFKFFWSLIEFIYV